MTANTIKRGDRHTITITVAADLTGSTVRLLARRLSGGDTIELDATITDATGGIIEHTLDGTLDDATATRSVAWNLEVEATTGGTINTAPTVGYLRLVVEPDLG